MLQLFLRFKEPEVMNPNGFRVLEPLPLGILRSGGLLLLGKGGDGGLI